MCDVAHFFCNFFTHYITNILPGLNIQNCLKFKETNLKIIYKHESKLENVQLLVRCGSDLNLANYKTAFLTGSKDDLVQGWLSFQGDMPNLKVFTLYFRRALLLWLEGGFLCLRS